LLELGSPLVSGVNEHLSIKSAGRSLYRNNRLPKLFGRQFQERAFLIAKDIRMNCIYHYLISKLHLHTAYLLFMQLFYVVVIIFAFILRKLVTLWLFVASSNLFIVIGLC
jgi:hypothetical protein